MGIEFLNHGSPGVRFRAGRKAATSPTALAAQKKTRQRKAEWPGGHDRADIICPRYPQEPSRAIPVELLRVARGVFGGARPRSPPVCVLRHKRDRGFCVFIELNKKRQQLVRHIMGRLIKLPKLLPDSLQNGAVTEPQRQDVRQLRFEVLLRAIQFF